MKDSRVTPLKTTIPAEVAAVVHRADTDFASPDENTQWQAAIAIGQFSETYPEAIWPLVEKWGSSADQGTRSAIATCVLEHVLEAHFQPFFTRIATLVNARNAFIADTFCQCWKLGQATEGNNSVKFDRLRHKSEQLRRKAGLAPESVESPSDFEC
jgi:hypothetical protein